MRLWYIAFPRLDPCVWHIWGGGLLRLATARPGPAPPTATAQPLEIVSEARHGAHFDSHLCPSPTPHPPPLQTRADFDPTLGAPRLRQAQA